MKFWKRLYAAAAALSLLTGLWHFFVPALFRWYDYLPAQHENLIVGIDYTNYCFSASLAGVSLLALLWRGRAFGGSREARQLYGLLTAVWLLRACLATVLEPWPPDPVPWAAALQLVLSDLLAAAMAAVCLALRKTAKNREREGTTP